MGWSEDLDRGRASASDIKFRIVAPLTLVLSVVFMATGRMGEGVAALVLGATMSFFAFLSWRAERRSRSFEDEG